jgi:hypothetical protein
VTAARARWRRAARLGLAVLASGLLAGCAKPPRTVPLPQGDARPRVLLDTLARTAAERQALRGVARLAIDGPAGSGRAKQVLVAARPARLRVEVLGFLDQTVAVLATDGERYRLFRAEDRSLDAGLVSPGLLWEVVGLAVTPEQAVRLLLGAPAPREESRVAGGALLGSGGVRVELEAPGRSGSERLEFDARERLVAWAELGADGSVRAEARFADFRPTAGADFPYEVELRDHTSGARARVRFVQVELNPVLPPGAFDLAVGAPGS